MSCLAMLAAGGDGFIACMERNLILTWAGFASGQPIDAAIEKGIGHPCHDALLGRSNPCPDCPLVEVFETGSSCLRHVTDPDGNPLVIQVDPSKQSDGKISGVVLAVRREESDLSTEDLDKLDNDPGVKIKITKSESKYRALLEHSPDIIVEIDTQGDILFSNRVLTGMKNEDAIGTSLLDYIPVMHHKKARRALYRSLVKKRNTNFETDIVTPGGIRWWSTRVLPQKSAIRSKASFSLSPTSHQASAPKRLSA